MLMLRGFARQLFDDFQIRVAGWVPFRNSRSRCFGKFCALLCTGADDIPRTPPILPGHLLPSLDLYRPGRDAEPAPGELTA